jgi:hypothetical protein
MWKAVQFWDRLWWMFCPIWNVGTIRNIVYGLHIPLHKLASRSIKFLPISNRISHKHIALQDPSCFNLQKLQKAQETGSLCRMYSMTNWLGVIGQVWDKSIRSPLHSATAMSHLCWLVGAPFNKFSFFLDRPRIYQDCRTHQRHQAGKPIDSSSWILHIDNTASSVTGQDLFTKFVQGASKSGSVEDFLCL